MTAIGRIEWRAPDARPGEPLPGSAVWTHGSPSYTAPYLFRQVRRWFHGDVTSAATYFVKLHHGFEKLGPTPDRNVCNCHGSAAWIRRLHGPRWDRFLAYGPDDARRAWYKDWRYVLADEGLTVAAGVDGLAVLVRWDEPEPDWRDVRRALRP